MACDKRVSKHYATEPDVGIAPVSVDEEVTMLARREASVADQVAAEPLPRVIFNMSVVLFAAEAEAVLPLAVPVVDDLGVRAVPTHLCGRPDYVFVAVHRDGYRRYLVLGNPDDDVFPVVVVSREKHGIFAGYVLLKVVAVYVGAPAVIAAHARVHVVVL